MNYAKYQVFLGMCIKLFLMTQRENQKSIFNGKNVKFPLQSLFNRFMHKICPILAISSCCKNFCSEQFLSWLDLSFKSLKTNEALYWLDFCKSLWNIWMGSAGPNHFLAVEVLIALMLIFLFVQ